jgi:hypothetical protein
MFNTNQCNWKKRKCHQSKFCHKMFKYFWLTTFCTFFDIFLRKKQYYM